MLLKEAGIIDDWIFVHPKDLQDGLFSPTENDVLANVPYVPGCGMWFDHHSSEQDRLGWNQAVKGESRLAPSAARIIYEYYGGAARFPSYEKMILSVDKVDSGNLTKEEILNPTGWILLGFISDPRTGLGRFRNFRISNYQLMEQLINHFRNITIEEILELPDVKERVELYREQSRLFADMVKAHTKVVDNVILSDLRDVETIYTGNRFMVYSLYPDQNVSLWIVDGKQKQNVSIACGYSILNRTCTADIGKLMLEYGGGGHQMVGTCQVPYDDADSTIAAITSVLKNK
ncbi:exopolyphosphatase [Acetobacterium fimetarium]|uniref:Exopolyphosphatase n=2 Tax=Acetobacterium fimetarium TaxID=52691 RepID=A0ABR6WS39_9FIRM|nr:exopolyphosphatase [Acetobacterium fimetarium]